MPSMRREVGRRAAAHALEDGEAADFADELFRVARLQRDDAEGDVLEHLDHDAAEAEHHHGAELRVRGHADDDLDAGLRHLLDGYAVDLRLRRLLFDRGLDALEGGTHGLRAVEGQLDAADIGLVRDVAGDDFEDDGVAGFGSGGRPCSAEVARRACVTLIPALCSSSLDSTSVSNVRPAARAVAIGSLICFSLHVERAAES